MPSKNIFHMAAGALDLPIPGITQLILTGTDKVHIENHRGLLGYGREEIVVSTGRGLIKVRGARLELEAMTDVELVIAGDIGGIEIERT